MTGGPEENRVELSAGERVAWLRLIRSENIGPATFRDLIDHFGAAQAALEALPDLARRGGARRVGRIASRAEAEAEIEAAERIGSRMIALCEPAYPPWLRQADAPPPLLGVRGATRHLLSPSVAVVGARNASVAGRKIAAMIAEGLGEADFVVVSGLARGIDSAAHEAALRTGTIAVFAGGLDRVYPPENDRLFQRIIEAGGCAVSEMQLGLEPRARDFPRRNRIIAGLTLGTVVAEAAERSGSLITARLALEQNRELMAVPGSPLDPRAAGSNRLLKQGAHLVTEAADIVDILAPILGRLPQGGDLRAGVAYSNEPTAEPAQDDRTTIIEALGPTPTEVDEIIRFTGAPARLVHVVLLELELAGRLERHAGQRVSLQ